MSKIGLVMGREFSLRVRKKSFIVTTLLMPLLMVAMIVVPVLIQLYGGDTKHKEIVVLDSSGIVGEKLENTENVDFILSESTYPSVVTEYPAAYGFLVVGDDIVKETKGVEFYTTENSTMSVESELKKQIAEIITDVRIEQSGVENLDSLISSVQAHVSLSTYSIEKDEHGEVSQKASSSGVAAVVAYISSFVIYMFILMYGMMVLNGVVEEKSNRVMEIMVSSVRPFQLMMGKILGIAAVAILQFLIWIILGGVGVVVIGMLIGSTGDVAAMGSSMAAAQVQIPVEVINIFEVATDPLFLLRVIGGFIIFFVGGYLLYASMYAAIGSAVDNAADTQQLQMPVTIPLIIAIFIMINAMQNPHSDLAFWGSIIPFTSPVIMMARIAYGVPVWEFVLSVVVLYGTFIVMTQFAAKIYRVGIFMYGKKPTFKELIKWVRYKY